VVAAQDEEVFRVLNFICQKEADGFEGLFSSIDVIAKKQIICLRREPAVFEKSKEVVVLPMNISANLVEELISTHRDFDRPETCTYARALMISYLDWSF